jgi:hypothetical protein
MKIALKNGSIVKFTRSTTPFKKGQIGVIERHEKMFGRIVYYVRPTEGKAAWIQRNNNLVVVDQQAATPTPKFAIGDRVVVSAVLPPKSVTVLLTGNCSVSAANLGSNTIGLRYVRPQGAASSTTELSLSVEAVKATISVLFNVLV